MTAPPLAERAHGHLYFCLDLKLAVNHCPAARSSASSQAGSSSSARRRLQGDFCLEGVQQLRDQFVQRPSTTSGTPRSCSSFLHNNLLAAGYDPLKEQARA
eukprot:scaffold439_cov415-Prasinococcus_capsulatus_cf.AAC.26